MYSWPVVCRYSWPAASYFFLMVSGLSIVKSRNCAFVQLADPKRKFFVLAFAVHQISFPNVKFVFIAPLVDTFFDFPGYVRGAG